MEWNNEENTVYIKNNLDEFKFTIGAVVGIINGYSGMGDDVKSLINDYFICGVDAPRPNNSIKDLAADTAKIALKTPNYELEVKECPFPLPERPKKFTGF